MTIRFEASALTYIAPNWDVDEYIARPNRRVNCMDDVTDKQPSNSQDIRNAGRFPLTG